MSNENGDRRDSYAAEPELIKDPQKLAEAEAKNGLRQYDSGIAAAHTALERSSFKLRLSLILGLHREALTGISNFAGNFRPGSVQITHSRHEPPPAHLVLQFVEGMCDYVNDHWETATALHLAAYVMWWLTSIRRWQWSYVAIVSYVVLSIKSGFIPPGTPTIPDQIVNDRSGYFAALDSADDAWRQGRIDVSVMEDLLGGMLAHQLTAFYERAGGKLPLSDP
jgi:Fic/DOC family